MQKKTNSMKKNGKKLAEPSYIDSVTLAGKIRFLHPTGGKIRKYKRICLRRYCSRYALGLRLCLLQMLVLRRSLNLC